jgi:hypothetical protein
MQHLEVSGAVVLYIGRTVSKGLQEDKFNEKLRNATSRFAIYVCPSVRMEQLGYHRTDLNEI